MATDARYRFWFVFALVALIGSGALLKWIDRSLGASVYRHAQQLEWVPSPAVAECIVNEWRTHGFTGTVTRGIIIDTFAFIPSYVLLLMVSCFWCAARLADPQIRRAAVVLGYASAAAGVLDLVENAGMLIELHQKMFWLAPYTAGAAGLKWLLATVIVLFLLGVVLQRRLLLGEDSMHSDPNAR